MRKLKLTTNFRKADFMDHVIRLCKINERRWLEEWFNESSGKMYGKKKGRSGLTYEQRMTRDSETSQFVSM